jgi:hypothetical protein
MDDEDLEPEVLTYEEFKNRQTLLAWRQRWRAHELKQEELLWAGAARPTKERYRAEGFVPSADR